jgi:hypothetical protein
VAAPGAASRRTIRFQQVLEIEIREHMNRIAPAAPSRS